MPPIIIEVSGHRCSGVDAVIQSLRHAFQINHQGHLEDVLLAPHMPVENWIIKSQDVQPDAKLNRFLQRGETSREKADWVRSHIRRVHIVRHPRDVFAALYRFNQNGDEPVFQIPRDLSFEDFLAQDGVQDALPRERRPAFWTRGVLNWIGFPDLVFVRWEAFSTDPNRWIDKMARHWNIPRDGEMRCNGLQDHEGDALWTNRAQQIFKTYVGQHSLDLLGYSMA